MAKGSRDDFTAQVKRTLSGRVGSRCSNPKCRVPTTAPKADASGVNNIGKAAHIAAAAPGGPRYVATMTPSARSGICNGIWLCSNCADMVDRDALRYPTQLLHDWKQQAEAFAQAEQGKPLPSERELSIFKAKALGENVSGLAIGELLAGVQHIAVQEIERLDPRFAAQVGFSHKGHLVISLETLEPVDCRLCVPIEKAKEFSEKLDNLQSHGHRLEIDASGMQIEGTPIFGDAFPPSSTLVMEPTLRQSVLHKIFWTDVESGKPKSAEFRGEMVGGAESVTFCGDLFGGLYHIGYQIPAKATGKVRLTVDGGISFQSWEGQGVQALPYFDQYLSLCKALADGQQLDNCIEIDGREFFSTGILQIMTQEEAQTQVNTLAHLSRVRDLAAVLKETVAYHPFAASREDVEYVFHTWLWLCQFGTFRGKALPTPSAVVVPGDENEAELLKKHVREGKAIVMKLERHDNRPLPLLGQTVQLGPLTAIWSSVVPKIKGRLSAIRHGKSLEFEGPPTDDCTLTVFVENSTSSV